MVCLGFERVGSDFLCESVGCSGWLYLPEGVENPPVVVMGHGFGAEKSFRLPAFAEKFVEAGLGVFLFDYRNFGGSEGCPRNLIDPFRHVEDWNAAIEHVRSLDSVNGDRIGLWGTSFSGGHVLVSGGKNRDVEVVVAQVPFVGFTGVGKPLKHYVDELGLVNSFNYFIRGFGSGMLDYVKSRMSGEAYKVPIVGEPDSFALLNTSECKSGYFSIVPEDSDWENKAPARIFFKLPLYRPLDYVSDIDCPALVMKAENDSLIPSHSVEKAISLIDDCEVNRLDCGHFDVYNGDLFERIVEEEIVFLKEKLS